MNRHAVIFAVFASAASLASAAPPADDRADTADDYVHEGAFIGATILDIRKVHKSFKIERGEMSGRVEGDGRFTTFWFSGRPFRVSLIRCDYDDKEAISKVGGFDGLVKLISESAGEPTSLDDDRRIAIWSGEKQTITVRYGTELVGRIFTPEGRLLNPGVAEERLYIDVKPTSKR